MTDEQIIEALATKVMCWRECPADSGHWVGCRHQTDWNPLTNPADSKMVREKLAARGWFWTVCLMPLTSRLKHELAFECVLQRDDSRILAIVEEGTTEERAVAMAALELVGVEVTPSPQ